ncbi:hypothetical protein [Mesorhizobium sp. M1B.F.Ca.ET.045.04.1.1]|uniref:hypothetical protein n=1 Tax=Mesorhizobium sp. M1B.F.Ca.ET.045.04.1.1 TaxID=2493673 RepID=UPI000F755726|nr:hypothetical protein [Mesorhizobium sp. M1B.F.Ca.ET.045.04.1.1]AZO29374.1 hypothetical protein EJ071_19605 [Mesorhizobium sp. M1B.F.Ca.ET.045.04.1.1]
MTTFEQFQASRREVDDVEAATNGDYPTDGKRAGFVYLDGFVIERTATGFYLVIENQQFENAELAPLEREMFDFYRAVNAAAPLPISVATIGDKIKLARAFGELVQAELRPFQFREMCDANKAEPENSGVCHSHDYFDANMIMLEAFKATFGREPAFMENPDHAADLELWNDAWAIAKAADFFA